MTARWLVCALVLSAACAVDRNDDANVPTWNEVAPIVTTKCASCHEGPSAQGGWHADSFLGAIACVSPSNAAAILPRTTSAPILQALSEPPHVGLLTSDEQAELTSWIESGAPAFSSDVHTPDIIDPRSPNFHGASLRALRWKPMLDPSDPNACGRCHDGTMSRPASVTGAAPNAPSCTSCHDQPGGILACGTCHGTSKHAYPPRDPCFFSGDPPPGPHAAHVEPSSIDASGMACSTCHPVPGANVVSGTHANGAVEVAFDPARVAPEASWDRTTNMCAVACHDRGGARPRPTWIESGPASCGDCHGSPPANHYAGACSSCHAEANANGTALAGGALHVNGRVDLGNGNGTCGACHGSGSSPWPMDAAHQAHANPTLSEPVACESCHVVPSSVTSPGHLGAPVQIVFSGHALDRGAEPTWDGTTCASVACHGAKLADPPAAPKWSDTNGASAACGACHGIPPRNHTTSLDCNRSTCHGTEVATSPT
ncbi:MAG: CxxxxCH/CxxCH domain c-type cytochrome, partial [Polyangiaceae bacterium]